MTLLRLFGDAGYDSKANHPLLRDAQGITSLIPPEAGRPSRRPASGKYRCRMQRLLKHREQIHFGQRWQVETIFSMIKRNLGHAMSGRSHWSRCREMLLLVITHNVMILRRSCRGCLHSISDTTFSLVFFSRHIP